MANIREGITTGTCAAAAAKAAARALFDGETPRAVDIRLPAGKLVTVGIASGAVRDERAWATVIKYSGADRDITDGAEITATVRRMQAGGITIKGGRGVGIVTLPGLQVPVGQHTINPVPRRMIEQAAADLLPEQEGLEIVVSVPRGEELARRTFNPRLGIIGGISILGTTGIVRPMCKEALICSLMPAMEVAKANGVKAVYLTPGNIGRQAVLKRFEPPPLAVLEISNYPGIMLERAAKLKFDRIILAGHPGKLAKLAAGYFCTDSAVSPSAVKTIMDIAGKTGAGALPEGHNPLLAESIIKCLSRTERSTVFNAVAAAVCRIASQRFGIKNLAVWLCDMQGQEVGSYGI